MFFKTLPIQLFQKCLLSIRDGTLHGKDAHNLYHVRALLIASSGWGIGTEVST